MTLQQPNFCKSSLAKNNRQILCHRCGAEVKFHKDKVGPKGHKIPLDPYFHNEPHAQHCMYASSYDPDTEPMLLEFLTMLPRKKRVIGAVGRAKN